MVAGSVLVRKVGAEKFTFHVPAGAGIEYVPFASVVVDQLGGIDTVAPAIGSPVKQLVTVPVRVPSIGSDWFQVIEISVSDSGLLYILNSSIREFSSIPVLVEYPPTLKGPAPLTVTVGWVIWFTKTPFL